MIRHIVVCDLASCGLPLHAECWAKNPTTGKFVMVSANGDTSFPAAKHFEVHACCRMHATEIERNAVLGPAEFEHPPLAPPPYTPPKGRDGKMAAANDRSADDDELLR